MIRSGANMLSIPLISCRQLKTDFQFLKIPIYCFFGKKSEDEDLAIGDPNSLKVTISWGHLSFFTWPEPLIHIGCAHWLGVKVWITLLRNSGCLWVVR